MSRWCCRLVSVVLSVISASAPRPPLQSRSGDRERFARWPRFPQRPLHFSASIIVVRRSARHQRPECLGAAVEFGSAYSPADSFGWFRSVTYVFTGGFRDLVLEFICVLYLLVTVTLMGIQKTLRK